ncbi:PH domain-containing protein [Bacteroides sp. 519]|uniref:PH domain-containing protein n=1 Tax=Bacteroides sp. 519 TaxID=2302937 RepID=UPI0013D3E7C7|nr:PH domain-containing protein [Bacteroides sp. 519]NDV57007.1 PH domain-containing protein [Bacteroides sp. 519]
MREGTVIRFRTIFLQPHWLQFIINELPGILLTGGCLIIGGIDAMPFANWFLAAAILLSLRLLYAFVYLRRTEYRINGEQLIMEHGVFTRKSDYLELYRIVDFNENRTLPQQICGLKSVTIYSGDRSNPKLIIPGVKNDLDLVSLIRERVEYNKQRKGIYEITNR